MPDIECPFCEQEFPVRPRDPVWTGTIRRELRCPHCREAFNHRDFPKGIVTNNQRVELITLTNGRHVALEDYDCTVAEATAFAQCFDAAWQHLPREVITTISDYWSDVQDSPHVWLLNNRREWNGCGWAAAEPDGRSMYFLATIAIRVPVEHLRTFVAHECGHILCISMGEPSHAQPMQDLLCRYRSERMVWQLMREWGFDQLAAETWMDQHVDERPDNPELRQQPLEQNVSREKITRQHNEIENRLGPFEIPHELEPFLRLM
jgi:hypothetical protein